MVTRLLSIGVWGRCAAAMVLALVTAVSGLQIPELTVDRNDDKLIRGDDPGWPLLRDMERDFGAEQNVLVYVQDRDFWQSEKLLQLQRVTFDLADIPEVTKVNSLFTTTNIRDKGDYVEAGPLIDLVPRSPEKIAELKDDALYSPLMQRDVISKDALATVISLGYQGDVSDPDLPLRMFEEIESRIAPLRGEFDRVFQTGTPRLNQEVDDGMFRDLRVLIPIAGAVLLTTISFFLRSLRALPIPLVTSALTLVWTFGFMAAAGIPLTLLTAMGTGSGNRHRVDRRRAPGRRIHGQSRWKRKCRPHCRASSDGEKSRAAGVDNGVDHGVRLCGECRYDNSVD